MTQPQADPSLPEPSPPEPSSLEVALVEVEQYVAADGWDQQGRLFALVSTAGLVEAQPELAVDLGAHDGGLDGLTPVEQEIDHGVAALEELLGHIGWPPAVVGVAAVVERLVLPPKVEEELPTDLTGAAAYAAEHPEREDVRIVAGVLRGGESHCVLRLRSHDSDDELLHGPDLVPGLLEALRETLEESDDEVNEDWGVDE